MEPRSDLRQVLFTYRGLFSGWVTWEKRLFEAWADDEVRGRWKSAEVALMVSVPMASPWKGSQTTSLKYLMTRSRGWSWYTTYLQTMASMLDDSMPPSRRMSATCLSASVTQPPRSMMPISAGENLSRQLGGTPRSKTTLLPEGLSTRKHQLGFSGTTSNPSTSGVKRILAARPTSLLVESMTRTRATAPGGTVTLG